MSYIRWGMDRQWTEGETIYAYPGPGEDWSRVVIQGQSSVRGNDWIEVTMRMLSRHDIDESVKAEVYDALVEELEDPGPNDEMEELRDMLEDEEDSE